MMQRSLLSLILSLLCSCNMDSEKVKFPWVVYYGDQAPASAFSSFNPIIFDSQAHPSIEPLLAEKKQVFGYVNLGEVSDTDPWFREVQKEKDLLIQENKDWPGSWSVDIRKPFWKNLILKQVIPKIIQQKFNGLFFDQLDVSLELEKENPEKYHGMTAAAIDLIKAIHTLFPDKWIMVNRSYEILSEIGNDIHYVLAETLYTSYDFANKKYYVRPDNEYQWQLSQLNQARLMFPHLVLFSLDYWYPHEKSMRDKIYSIEQSHCIRPYVTTIDLGEVPQ